MAKKYDKHFGYQLESDATVSHYNFSKNTINLSERMIGRTDFEHTMFAIFHEFRHKMQHDDIHNMYNDINSILSIDPATIVLLKERVTHMDTQLYNANHDCFIMEHDANLFSLSECSLFIDKKQLEQDYREIGEANNYINAMITNVDLSSEEFHDKQHLPIVYEQDYRYKKFISSKRITNNSMLSLIYNSDGTSKTYQELIDEKKKLIEKYKGQTIDRKTSTTNYEHWSSPKRAEEHIEEIFKLIIASDPILTLQEYLSKYNNLKGQVIANQWLDKANRLIENCPQLIDIYSKEITNILKSEVINGNKEFVQNIIEKFPDKEVSQILNGVITVMNSKPVSKINLSNNTGYNDDFMDADQYEEKVPFESKKEEQIKYRPIISESVKKSVILHDEKQKLYEHKQKLIEQERIIKEQSEQEGLEEENGMSM